MRYMTVRAINTLLLGEKERIRKQANSSDISL
jgi:hypothetical protein